MKILTISLLLKTLIIFSAAAQNVGYENEEFFLPTKQQVEKDYSRDDYDNYTNMSPTVFKPQKPTPSRFFAANLSMPSDFASSNNLIKKAGSFYRAHGEVIFLQGKITDSFGVPIMGAVVEIWQTNAAGKYHTLLEADSKYIDKYFNMSGQSISDNMGNYYFVTIMPGPIAGRAPHINANIYHSKFGRLETEIYFENHPLNVKDYQYLAYEDYEREALTALVRHSNIANTNSIKLFTHNIILEGIHDYKGY